MTNVNNAITVAISTITTEHTALTNQLTTLEAKYKAEREAIVSQLDPLSRALEALTGTKAVKAAKAQGSDGKVRKPMSDEEGQYPSRLCSAEGSA